MLEVADKAHLDGAYTDTARKRFIVVAIGESDPESVTLRDLETGELTDVNGSFVAEGWMCRSDAGPFKCHRKEHGNGEGPHQGNAFFDHVLVKGKWS